MTGAITKAVTWQTRLTKESREAAAWIEGSNPLRGMTVSRAQALFDASRQGDTVHLQWLYNEIEAVDPTLLVCAERRSGAMVTPDWKITKRKASRVRGYDEKLADEQVAMLEAEYGRADMSNLTKALEHLSLGFFRGFSHVAPLYTYDGMGLAGFDILDGWNFKRNIDSGRWLWDPSGSAYSGLNDLDEIPYDELCSVVRSRHIDYPALTIFLRAAVGEKLWGQFMERYGIPPVTIIMPPNIPDDKVSLFLAAAEKVAQGGTGALPNGSEVSYATEARGTDPFTSYLDHQQKLVVLMATGGLATSLEAVSGLNSSVGEAHESTWTEVWRRDAVVIADSMNTSPTRLLLNRNFPDQPHLAFFEFDTEPARGPASIFEDATKARTAGYTIVQEDLEKKTGYTLIPYEPAAANPLGGFAMNSKAQQTQSTALNSSDSGVASPLQNRLTAPNAKLDGEKAVTPVNDSDALLAALAKDMSAAGKAVAELLAITDPEKLKAAAADLAKKLPELLNDDPAMAALIETAIAEAFAESAKEVAK